MKMFVNDVESPVTDPIRIRFKLDGEETMPALVIDAEGGTLDVNRSHIHLGANVRVHPFRGEGEEYASE
jgi:hypothetical protein